MSLDELNETLEESDEEGSRDLIKDESPSVKLTYIVLEEKGEMTLQQIEEESKLPYRTVYDAVNVLEDLDVVDKRPYPHDIKQNIYSLNHFGQG